ncbi:hypothetical protein FOZ63_025344, partial [Perkinsus olseni]
MAGQAEKKNKARAEQLTKGKCGICFQYYFFAVAIVNSIYISYKVLPQWNTFDAYNILGFILFSVVSYFTYNSIISSLKLGVPADSSNDLFIINLTTQFLVTFTSYGWYLYLTVPAYLLYKAGLFIKDYAFAGAGQEE